ncbi:hypothetical protein EO95_11070 [Methanosarcina sp. 1.H.T.1A.1]|nr:hypothetical protein EO95_11070 [Methanosarcina sp. 1.H.T.1A.1]
MILSKEKTPDYWEIVPLGNVCLKATKVKRKEVDIEKELIYLDIGSIDNVTNRITEHKVYNWKDAPSRAQQIVQVGDILFSTVRVYLRNIAKIDSPLYENQICSSGFTVIRGYKDCCDSKYLFAITLYEGFLQPLNELQTGTSYPAVRDNDVFSQLIPLPPLPEQRAIVSKIEQLFSELDNGIANLKLAQEQLKVYRQAVLKKAFEGELTRKWRKSNENGDVEQLLSEINKERLKYFQNKGKKIKQVKPISEEEILELIPLPENWKRVRLNDLSFLITDGKHGDCKNHENSGYFFISAKDIFDGKINYVDARQIQKEDFEEVHKRTDLEPDDVLVTNAGTIGRIAIATANDKTSKTTFQKSVAIIKKPNSLIDSKYLAYHLENDVERIKLASKGTAQKNLLLGTMSELIIAICSVEEQQAIVQEIETRLSVCDKIEQDIKENLEKAEALRQSILKKAFEGKLLNESELAEVRGAEDWEPAEVLLERIRKERAENGNKGKQNSEQLKSITQDDKGLAQQSTLQVFEQVDK